jgi:quercetin dioxygenase-like cupin family protein
LSERKRRSNLDNPQGAAGRHGSPGVRAVFDLGGAAVKRTSRRAAIAAVGVTASAVAVTAALASPPSGFRPTNLVDEAELKALVHVNSDRIKFQTKEPVDVRVQTVTFDAHGFSGWHHHPGIVIVAVKSGAVTVTHGECKGTVYGIGAPNGSAFVEYGDEPAEVRNKTNKPAKLYATFIAPDADPGVFRIEDEPIC